MSVQMTRQKQTCKALTGGKYLETKGGKCRSGSQYRAETRKGRKRAFKREKLKLQFSPEKVSARPRRVLEQRLPDRVLHWAELVGILVPPPDLRGAQSQT